MGVHARSHRATERHGTVPWKARMFLVGTFASSKTLARFSVESGGVGSGKTSHRLRATSPFGITSAGHAGYSSALPLVNGTPR